MKARVYISQDGKIEVFVDEGGQAEAATRANMLMQAIGLAVTTVIDLPITINPPEAHRHDGLLHTHTHTHAHAHTEH